MPAVNNFAVGSRRLARRRPHNVSRWLLRALQLGAVMGAGMLLVLSWRDGRFERVSAWLEVRALAVTAEAGFTVEDVEVTGRDRTDPKALLAAVGLQRGEPILGFSPEAARRQIEGLPWVASAAVERRLPDTVAITILERRPIALWQHNEHLSLIDADGINLGPAAMDGGPHLPLVVGGDAPAHAAEFLSLLQTFPEVARRVQASSWIGSRRWDLKLDNDVRLPEDGVADALRQLSQAEASSRLFERDVSIVDLRLSGKMIVRLAHGATAPKSKPQQGI